MKRKVLSWLFLSSSILLGACSKEVDLKGLEIKAVGDVTTLSVGQTLQLSVKAIPDGAPIGVTWSSTDVEKASVSDSGLVSALSEGNVKIKATSTINSVISTEYSLVITEKVDNVKPTSITLSTSNNISKIKVNDTIKINVSTTPEDASKQVTYSSEPSDIVSVSEFGIVTGKKEGTAKITATSKLDSNVKGEIQIEVEKADDDVKPSQDWGQINISTHQQYVDAAKDTLIKVKGTVTFVTPSKDNLTSYYLTDGADGYYIYNQNTATLPIEKGKSYIVGGKKTIYNGTHEIKDIELCEETDVSIAPKTETDVSALAVDSLEDMKQYQSSWVKLVNAEIVSLPTSFTKAYSVTVKTSGGKQIDLRIDPSTTAEFDDITTKFKSTIVGGKLDVTGIMSAFGYGKAKNQISVVQTNDISISQLSDADKVNVVSESLTLPNSVDTATTQITLPTTNNTFDTISITWQLDDQAQANIIDIATGSVTHPLKTTDVKLNATITSGSESKNVKLTTTVFGTDTNEYSTLHTFNLEDALPATDSSYGMSPTKGYKPVNGSDNVTLGNPAATWMLRNTAIAGDTSDHRNGTFAMRSQFNADAAQSGRIELITNTFEFTTLEFKAQTFGSDPSALLKIEYINPSIADWVHLRDIHVSTSTLETIRISLPEITQAPISDTTEVKTRVAITVLSGKRVNIDDVLLLNSVA